MRIRIRNVLDFIKYSETDIDADINKPFRETMELIVEHLKLKSRNIKYIIVRSEGQKEICDYGKSLEDYGYKEEDSIQLEHITTTRVIPAYLVTVISYSGPPIIFLLFLLFNYNNSDFTKILATILVITHFCRRIYESTYIFQMGVETFPLFSPTFLGVCFYYWVLFGAFGAYSIFTTTYTDKTNLNIVKLLMLNVMFLYAEYNNSECHLYLAELKQKNNNQRGIPRGGLFEYVSCAHYFWELMTWIVFSFIVETFASRFFIVTSLLSMASLAADKHKSLKNYFGDEYPKDRKAFIPFII